MSATAKTAPDTAALEQRIERLEDAVTRLIKYVAEGSRHDCGGTSPAGKRAPSSSRSSRSSKASVPCDGTSAAIRRPPDRDCQCPETARRCRRRSLLLPDAVARADHRRRRLTRARTAMSAGAPADALHRPARRTGAPMAGVGS